MEACRVCDAPSPEFYRDSRVFYRCPVCTHIFTTQAADDKAAEEHYKKQWNTADEAFWRQQVDGLLTIIQRYRTPRRILDFGSGSGEITGELTSDDLLGRIFGEFCIGK